MATVTAPIALDSTLQSTNTALTAQNALLTSANSNSLADVMEDGIANIVSAIGAIPTPTAANVSFDDSQAGLGESNVQGAIEALNDNLANKVQGTIISNITADSNGIYTSSIPYTTKVIGAYISSGYIVIPFIATNVWKFQLLTNSGTGFVNGASGTGNLMVYSVS